MPSARRVLVGAVTSVGAAALVGGVVIGCAGEPGVGTVPTTRVLRSGAVTTIAVDHSRDELPTLATELPTSTRPPAFGRGSVSVVGTVTGPAGPVVGASVRLERLVGDAVAVRTVGTDSTGRFRLDGIAGGRLRVRAWRAPDLAQATPVVLFAADRASVELRLESYAGTQIDWNVAPRPPITGRSANLVVQLSTRTVGSDGTVTAVPSAGVGVTVVPTGLLQGEITQQTTDATGRTVFTMGCYGIGPAGFQLRLASGETREVDGPPCSPVPTTTTTTTTTTTVAAGLIGSPSTVGAGASVTTRATVRTGSTSTLPVLRSATTVGTMRVVPTTGRVVAGTTTTTLRRVAAGAGA